MSASELIEEAKRLSREERDQLIESLLAMDFDDKTSACRFEKVDWSDTFERAKQIFGDRVIPNMVLEERESYNS